MKPAIGDTDKRLLAEGFIIRQLHCYRCGRTWRAACFPQCVRFECPECRQFVTLHSPDPQRTWNGTDMLFAFLLGLGAGVVVCHSIGELIRAFAR